MKTKKEVHYRQGGVSKRCAKCTMFREPDKCTLVEGKIDPNAVCDYYKAKR